MIRTLLAAGVLALAIAACGDDDGDTGGSAGGGYGGGGVETSPETPTAETTTEATTANGGGAAGGGETVEIVETDFAIDPARPTTEAGAVTFAIENKGDTVHNLEVEGNGVEEVSDDVAAGERTALTVDVERGSYKLYCAIPGHEELGMTGELTVK